MAKGSSLNRVILGPKLLKANSLIIKSNTVYMYALIITHTHIYKVEVS